MIWSASSMGYCSAEGLPASCRSKEMDSTEKKDRFYYFLLFKGSYCY